MKSCKKYPLSNIVGGTGDDMLQNDGEEDGNVRSECGEYEGTDCEDGDRDSYW